jgi:hypothetical protein
MEGEDPIMSRAAFLPSPGDPFVLMHCIKYFKEVWADEVDRLYININSDIEAEVVEQLMKDLEWPGKITTIYTNRTMGHGWSISRMLDECGEQFILLIEDDSIIFRKGWVDSMFKKIESEEYDVIGSPRMSCSPLIAEIAKEKLNLNYEGWGDKGPNFWPCFLFTRKSLLAHTDRHFGNKKWMKGTELLGTILPEEVVGDTFVNTSLQLRSLTEKILEIPQYHCTPDDFQNAKDGRGMFDGTASYMHFGSLSSGIENTLLDPNGKPLKDRKKEDTPAVKIHIPDTDQEKSEMEKRVMWWTEASATWNPQPDQKTTGFHFAYGYGIGNLIKYCKLSISNINNWRKLYMKVIKDAKQN